MSTSLESSISVVIETSEGDDNDVYKAFTHINAIVFHSNAGIGTTNKAIGEISGIAINRQKIPENCYWESFDEHSATMEWVASNLIENRHGRTTLKSLRDAGDDPEFDFFLMENFRMDENQHSDVATFALRKFLRSKEIKGNSQYNDVWFVSSMAYVLSAGQSPNDNDTESTGKRKRDESNTGSSTTDTKHQYHESIPFLRNGFFQDTALVRKDPDNARILVAGVNHFEKDLKSEAEVMPTTRALSRQLSNTKLDGKDAEILSRVETLVNRNYEISMTRSSMNLSSVMIGAATYTRPQDCTDEYQLQILKQDLTIMVNSGGSIAKSTALHAACDKNSIKIVNLLLEMDAASTNTKDALGRTPLLVAAINATGRLSINGIDDTAVVDALLASGASKPDVDSVGMTAYGYFRKSSEISLSMTHYHHQHKITDLEHKLYPPGGPRVMDFAKGLGGSSGFVDYRPEDDEADREMGRCGYDSSGDY
eukprot:scaffold42485_cov50-Attheya_sp.AAC.5